MWLHLAGLAACGIAAAALLAAERRRADDTQAAARRSRPSQHEPRSRKGGHPKQQRKKLKTPNRAALAAELGGGAAEYIPAADELAAVAALTRTVHAARGWRGGRYHVSQAWARVESYAAADAGGSWAPQFDPSHLTDARLTALAAVIDSELLGGLLGRGDLLKPLPWMQLAGDSSQESKVNSSTLQSPQVESHQQQQQQQPQALTYRAVHAPRETWIACFAEGNSSPTATQRPVVYVNTARWTTREVSRAAPINCEGIVCTNRLQLLVHSLAHEMVHAIVAAALPAIHAGSEAYRADDCHGPIFKVLNRQLFGHPSNSMTRCDARAAL